VNQVARIRKTTTLVSGGGEASDREFEGLGMPLATHRISVTARLILLAVMISFFGCNKTAKPSLTAFSSPDEAGNALLAAAKAADQNALLAIFGTDSRDVILSGDAVQDKATVGAFVTGYEAMHRWRKMPDGSQVLLIGAQNFPFPIPLKRNDGGQWFFDTAAGKEEILRRRIGRNELSVIDVCGALANAQADYYSRRHEDGSTKQFALKFISDPGKQNGLYWDSPEGQPKSPLGPLLAYATSEGYSVKPNAHQPFHGYYFNMLKGQGSHAPGGARDYLINGKMVGGFAFVAYPAEYGNSGVMTFMMNQDGVLLQKDLGKTTTETASALTEFNPDASWTIVQE
jgi:Protein of unknown function (DUF2950)